MDTPKKRIAEQIGTSGKQALPLSKVAVRFLFAYKDTVHIITFDNGSEFAEHEFIAEKLKADFYFAHP